jgi:hypothetical protein
MKWKWVTRSEQLFDHPDAAVTATEIMLDDDPPVRTGLLDASGQPLYRVRERGIVGFDLRGTKR